LSQAAQSFASAQAATDLARVACALERHWLAHGAYPDALNALSPAFLRELPRDVISGRPLVYRHGEGERFVLYSVGWNETDDSGLIARTPKGNLDRAKGD